MNDILKVVKSLEDSGVLLKGVSETKTSGAKEQSGGFLSILLDTLVSSLLTDMLLNKKAKKLLELEKKPLELVMDLKNFDSPPINKL